MMRGGCIQDVFPALMSSSGRFSRHSPLATLVLLVVATAWAVPAAAQYPNSPAAQALPPITKKKVASETAQLDLIGHVMLDASPSAQAAADDKRAYIPLKGGRLVAVDLTKSTVLWSLDIDTKLAPAMGDGLVFVAGDEFLTALTAEGAVRWTMPLGGGFSAPLLWDSGWLIAPATSGDVLCLRASDGQVLWTRNLGSPVSARPTIGGDRVYLSLENGRVVALGLKDGASIWEHQLGGTPGPVFALDDRVFVGARDKFFYCLNTKNGKRRWRWRTGGTIVGTAVVDPKRVYFTALDNVVRGLDRNNGSQHWQAGLPLRPTSGPLLLGSVLFVGGVAAELRAYTVKEGLLAGQYDAPSDLAAPPQLLVGEIPELSQILLLTRTGELQVLRRQLEPAIVPLVLPIGVVVPLDTPPVPVTSAEAPLSDPAALPLYDVPGTLTTEPPFTPP
jgi:outer membrane protein assembly factor BamB